MNATLHPPPARLSAVLAPLVTAVALLASCRDDAQMGKTRVIAFSDAYELVDSLRLQRSERVPLLEVTVPVPGPGGLLAVTDYAEAHVGIFDRKGRLVRRIGRKGGGPAEFYFPVGVDWDTEGRLHVLDPQRMRIAIFGPDGEYLRQVSLARAGNALDFALLENGDYLLVSLAEPRDLLVRMDSTGGVRSKHLPIAGYMPEGQENADLWRSAAAPSIYVRGDTVWTGLSIGDSVWTADLATGAVTAVHVAPPGYRAPRDPPDRGVHPLDDPEFGDSYDHVSGLVRLPGGVLVTYTTEIGDTVRSTSVIVRDNGTREILRDSPVILRTDGDRLVSYRSREEDDVVFLYWRRKPRRESTHH